VGLLVRGGGAVPSKKVSSVHKSSGTIALFLVAHASFPMKNCQEVFIKNLAGSPILQSQILHFANPGMRGRNELRQTDMTD
jgi:hypothetical protein